ncbi:MAG: hypothetical protein U9R19_09570, partial [Bacteroidota bacterium]|nr:hypothetical protein [Bacteroidota bacterium]
MKSFFNAILLLLIPAFCIGSINDSISTRLGEIQEQLLTDSTIQFDQSKILKEYFRQSGVKKIDVARKALQFAHKTNNQKNIIKSLVLLAKEYQLFNNPL